MKTTIKEYNAKAAQRKMLNQCLHMARQNQDYSMEVAIKASLEQLEAEYFSKLPKVNTSFMIGYRSYYREVVKIGKTYFDGGDKMTKGRGYRCIEEIPEITERMKKEMIADSYYY